MLNFQSALKYFGFIALTTFVLSACNKVGKTAKFDMEYDGLMTIEDTFVVDAPYDVFTPSIATNSQATFSSKNTNNELVETITLTSFSVEVSNPSGANLEALDSVWIYMSAPGYSEALIAEKANILNVATAINFDDFLQSNLKPYLIQPEILFRLRVYLDNTLAQDLILNLHANFHVEAKEE